MFVFLLHTGGELSGDGYCFNWVSHPCISRNNNVPSCRRRPLPGWKLEYLSPNMAKKKKKRLPAGLCECVVVSLCVKWLHV